MTNLNSTGSVSEKGVILVIEDDESSILVIKIGLEKRFDLDIVIAEDMATATRAIRKYSKRLVAVAMDTFLGRFVTANLVGEIKKTCREATILATSSDDLSRKWYVESLGCNGSCEKYQFPRILEGMMGKMTVS